MTDIPDSAVLYCAHCGNTSVQTHLLAQNYREKFYSSTNGAESLEPATYHVVRCETCSEILVYSYCHLFPPDDMQTAFGDLLYPKQTAFTDAVPERVRKAYLEAAKVKNISPIAFVVLARRVLEEVSAERGVTQKNLAAALEQLAKQGELPPVLAKASTLVRLIGNAGAHAGGVEIHALHTWPIDDFLKAVIEYLYVAPSKIADFQKSFKHAEDAGDMRASGDKATPAN